MHGNILNWVWGGAWGLLRNITFKKTISVGSLSQSYIHN